MVSNNFEETIKSYLDKRSEEDSLFARAYAKAGKTIKECCNYIVSQARKMQQNGCAVIADDIVFGWAVHYYDEDDVKIDENLTEHVEVHASEPENVITHQTIKPLRKKRKEDNSLQLSLFGEI